MLTSDFQDRLQVALDNEEIPLESRIVVYMKNGAIFTVDSVEIDGDGDVVLNEGESL